MNCGNCLLETVEVIKLASDGSCPNCGSDPESVWHGQDIEAATKRARRIQGRLVQASGPNSMELGYWSEPQSSYVRSGDRILRKF